MRVWVIGLVLVLAGCAEPMEEPEIDQVDDVDDVGNATVAVSLGLPDNLTAGAPFNVTIAADLGDNASANATWLLEAFDANATAGTANSTTDTANSTTDPVFTIEGTGLPATVALNLTNGTYLLRASVLAPASGVSEATIVVDAVEAVAGPAFGPIPDPIQFTGTHTGAPTIVVNGCVSSDTTHEFTVDVPVRSLTATLSFPGGVGNDLDWAITGPGVDHASAAGGGEAPATFDEPAPGEWSITVECWSADGSVDYTVDVEFA